MLCERKQQLQPQDFVDGMQEPLCLRDGTSLLSSMGAQNSSSSTHLWTQSGRPAWTSWGALHSQDWHDC